MNTETANFRIMQCNKGYVVEVKKPKWTIFGIKWRWVHYISVGGISEQPWYFSNKEFAEQEALKHIKWDIIKNSKK